MKRIYFTCLFVYLTTFATLPAHAQTETVLYNFTGGSDGASPQSNLTSHDGAFYGTTYGGGLGYGTVFELSPNGSGGWNETVLYSFTGGADGYDPNDSVIFDSVGNLYGTTTFSNVGHDGGGVVFKLSPAGAGESWTETVLCNTVGLPTSGLIMDPQGNLYGTSQGAGVFELSSSGGVWTEQFVYGETLDQGVSMDSAGDLFASAGRKMLELSANGEGGWSSDFIHTFPIFNAPSGTVAFDQANNLYGVLSSGGAKEQGAVYKLSLANGKWTSKLLYSFKGGSDGARPYAGIVFDASGDIYGTTLSGGTYGEGTVFELVPVGKTHYSYKEKILWSFTGADGASPSNSLTLDSAGNLYGTAPNGGSYGYGVVFEVTP
ncbi:MAG: choice-of-anchor tandem repeat GloVer-containing protein [Terriglobales bacterium]